MACHFKEIRFLKQILTAGICVCATLPFLAQASENPNDWVVTQSLKVDANHLWNASTLYLDKKKQKPSVCALDYQVLSDPKKMAHPFVFLVSRMSRELWTTDRAWNLNGREEARLTLTIAQQKHVFEMDPENEHIFMSLVSDEKIDTILGALENTKKAELSLSAGRYSKELSLPIKGLSPVLEAFRHCISAPELAYGKKPNVTNDEKLPKVFKE